MITLMCTALVTGLAFAHVLELPQKMSYDAAEYARVQHSLYAYFASRGGAGRVGRRGPDRQHQDGRLDHGRRARGVDGAWCSAPGWRSCSGHP